MDSLSVADRLEVLHRRISGAGRDPSELRIVAVTKGFDADAVAAARAAGIVDVGENYAQELTSKRDALGEEGLQVRWHFLGAVQSNKVARLAGTVDLWQSVDRVAAGRGIAKRAPAARVLVQVNLTGEAQKLGCSWDDAPATIDALQGLGLDVRGVMGVASQEDQEEARAQFRRLAALARGAGLPELSMGMSDDLELAVQEGATMLRIGRALFGPRPGAREVRR